MNENDIKRWISDNEQDIFCDSEEPKYIPSPVVEDFIDELTERQVGEVLEVKKKALQSYCLDSCLVHDVNDREKILLCCNEECPLVAKFIKNLE